MNTMRSALCAAFAVLVSAASAADAPKQPEFYDSVKNPNVAANGVAARLAFIDTGVPAKSGIEVEADIQCDNTLFKNAYNKGLTGYGAGKLVMPLCFNPGSTDVKDSCLCFGYGPESDLSTFKGGSVQKGASPFKLEKNGRYQVRVRLCAGEQWLEARKNGEADYTRVITSALPEAHDTGTTLKLFAYGINAAKKKAYHGTPYIIYSMKIYTVEGTGKDAVRTLVRDYAPCAVPHENGAKMPALYDKVQCKAYFNENKQVDGKGNVAGLVFGEKK